MTSWALVKLAIVSVVSPPQVSVVETFAAGLSQVQCEVQATARNANAWTPTQSTLILITYACLPEDHR